MRATYYEKTVFLIIIQNNFLSDYKNIILIFRLVTKALFIFFFKFIWNGWQYGCYYSRSLRFVPDCYKICKLCNKCFGAYHSAIHVASECYRYQEMSDKLMILVQLHFILFLINVWFKKCAINLFPQNLSC